MDLLGDILATLDLRATLYFRAELTAPFSMAMPTERHVIRFHVVSEGTCWIMTPQGEKLECNQGDLLLIPHGATHVVASACVVPPLPLTTVLQDAGYQGEGLLRYGGGGERAALVCGYFGFDEAVVHPVIATLPNLIHIRQQGQRQYAWLAQLLEHIGHESENKTEAWGEVVRRMSEILFIQVLREYMAGHPNATGALMALADPRLGRALKAIHGQPSKAWSVDELASLANMSRSVFIEHFRAGLGTSPARYLTTWRMYKARSLLATQRTSVEKVANAVGYQSETAFNRAFKAQFGVAPGRYQRANTAPVLASVASAR